MLHGYKKYIWFLLLIAAVFALSTFVVGRNNSAVVIKKGINKFPNGLQVPENKTLVINPGATLVMGEGTKIEVKGSIVAKGTKENPIIFTSENNILWRGINIIGKNDNLDLEGYKQALKNKTFNESDYLESIKKGNIFNYCHFENLAAENKERVAENRLKAAIEAGSTVLAVSNSIFNNIVNIGCVKTDDSIALVNHNFTDSKLVIKAFHFVRSFHITYGNKLIPERDKRLVWPVGIYTKEGVGIIYGNEIQGFGDNGIDDDNNCLIYIIKNTLKNNDDDGIDVDYQSEAYIAGNEIDSSLDNGIIISEQSKAVLVNNEISNANVGIMLRNGGKAIVKNTNISESKYGMQIFNQVPLLIDKKDFSDIENKIKSLNKSDWDYYGTYTINNSEDAIKLLESSYDNHGGIYVFNKKVLIQDLTTMFKFINVFGLKDIQDVPSGITKEDINADLFYNEIKIEGGKIAEDIPADKDFLTNSFFTADGCCSNKNLEGSNIYKMLSDQSIFQDENGNLGKTMDMSSYIEDLIGKIEKYQL